MKAKITPRSTKKSGGSHTLKPNKLSNDGPKGGTLAYKGSKVPVLTQPPVSQVDLKIKAMKHK